MPTPITIAPLHLVARRTLVEDAASIDHRDDTAHPQPCNAGVPGHFHKLRSIRVHGVLFHLGVLVRRIGFAFAARPPYIRGLQYLLEGTPCTASWSLR